MRERPTAANRVLALLSKMMNLAERWGLRPDGSNPCRHVERYRETKRERYLSEAELARLGAALAAAEQTGAEEPEVVAALRLLVFTGCRMGEILGLCWECVDFERRCLNLPDSKTGAKTVPLNVPALEVLAGLERRSEYVIPGRDPRHALVNLSKPWDRIRVAAKLEGVRIHDLRHSFAAVAAGSGHSLLIIGGLLGHKQAQTTRRYAHLSDDPLRAASEAVGGRIAAALARRPEAEVLPLVPAAAGR
jgi:integrase